MIWVRRRKREWTREWYITPVAIMSLIGVRMRIVAMRSWESLRETSRVPTAMSRAMKDTDALL